MMGIETHKPLAGKACKQGHQPGRRSIYEIALLHWKRRGKVKPGEVEMHMVPG